jgi:hypothetical protein
VPESQTLRRQTSQRTQERVSWRFVTRTSRVPCCRLRKPVHIFRSPNRSSLNAVVLRAITGTASVPRPCQRAGMVLAGRESSLMLGGTTALSELGGSSLAGGAGFLHPCL